MSFYASNGALESSEAKLKLVISTKRPLSLYDYGELFRDIDTIFKISARETSQRMKGGNDRTRDAAIVIDEFKSGSLEIFANAYFEGIVTNVTAAAIIGIFAYALRRVEGKPADADREPTQDILTNAISEEKIRDSASATVTATAQQRKRIKSKKKIFGLQIKITFNNQTYIS